MITLQQTISYAGDPATAPLSGVTLAFDFPVYAFAPADGAAPRATRQDTGTTRTWSVPHALADLGYRVTPGNGAVTGDEDAVSDDAWRFYLDALRAGAVSDLALPVTARFSASDGIELGEQGLDALCLVKLPFQASSLSVAEAAAPSAGKDAPADYVLLNHPALERLRTQAASLDVSDSLILRLISVLTVFDGGTPSISAEAAAAIGQLVKGTDTGASATAVSRLARLIIAASGLLFDFALLIPRMRTLAIRGMFTVLKADHQPALAADFQRFEIAAEYAYGAGGAPRQLSFRFGGDVAIADSTADFSLTAALLQNGLQDPVRVQVKGLDGAVVWSEEHPAADPALAALAIKVQAQDVAILSSVPPTAQPDQSRKLRGQVLTFAPDCPLNGALVLIQAKSDGDADWHIVGAGTTDGSGAFTIPYPYGSYTDARALVSLAPSEPAPITVHRDRGNATIADDVLYLLLRNPRCPEPKEADECECGGGQGGAGSRLPDHADLIGSDAYSQDIGGSCVNLSKPNRTISEYNFQGIVRTSDPDVANYTLTRYEQGLADIDVHLLALITSLAAGLGAAADIALANATAIDASTRTNSARRYLTAVNAAQPHVADIKAAVAGDPPQLGLTELATLQTHVDYVIAVLDGYQSLARASDEPVVDDGGARVIEVATAMRAQAALAIDSVGVAVRYELTGGAQTRTRSPVALNNPVLWQDAPEPPAITSRGESLLNVARHGALTGAKLLKVTNATQAPAGQPAGILAQAVSVATGHVLHYKAVVKADGYSLGDLIYSLPLAPGQKKEIVVFDASHSLVGAETQSLTQNERLAMGLSSERDITDQLAGNISESLRGSSTADTRGLSAGFGTAGQGYGGTGAYGGSGGVVIGVAGGWAQASSQAQQDSSRGVAQYFGEKLRESVMQNAEGYRRLNASVVTTVQEGQRYGVTSEVVANHNHCHALTMMYFEVLRHLAVFQELSFVEECVFIPLLLTRFTTENVGRWRDVLAPALLPMASDTYLRPSAPALAAGRPHPLVKAFDADQRIRTHYANVDFPAGAYDEEQIQFIRGTARLRVNLPRPRTRFDRILSFPIVKQLDTAAFTEAAQKFAQDSASYAIKAGATAGLYTLFSPPPTNPPNPEQYQVLAREAVFDSFMQLDANYQTVPPAQCIRIMDFTPKTIPVLPGFPLTPGAAQTELEFFADNIDDRRQWGLYSKILGYTSVGAMLNAHFKGNLISEWDTIFQQDIAPLVFEKILDAIQLDHFATDFSSPAKYHGGERLMDLDLLGTTAKSRDQLPVLLGVSVSDANIRALKNYVTLYLDSASIGYSTAHFNGALFSGPVRDELLDGARLAIPENSEDKRNPRREDRYLAARLIEHLNSNLEYYNKVLWYNLDPDRRYMLLDGFSIQVYDGAGNPLPGPGGLRSLASVVKNDVISVAGNALVMPVAPGYRVSGSFISVPAEGDARQPTLLDHYQPLTPVPPYRISVPSTGVFAEAVMGACNSCEKIETERLQDWSRYPIGDEPTAISPVAVPTPAVTDWQAAFKDFAAPIVNVQNAPAAPAPGAGLAGLSQLLGQAGVFKDITGLDANQQNAIKTFLSDQENAKAFGEMAKEMAMQQHNTQNSGKILDSIAQAKSAGDITKQEAGQLVRDHLQQQIDGGAAKKAEADAARQAAPGPYSPVVAQAVGQNKTVTATRVAGDGSESVTIGAASGTSPQTAEVTGTIPRITQEPDKNNDCWAVVAAMMLGWKYYPQAITAADAAMQAGQRFLKMYTDDTGLPAADKDDFLLHSEMAGEPPASYVPQDYIGWVKAYGPLWVTIDSDPAAGQWSPHALILTKISGGASADGSDTQFTLIDPRTGTELTQAFPEFVKGFEQLAAADTRAQTGRVQVAHFIDPVDKPEGYEIQGPFNIHEPIHETITLAALQRSAVAVPASVRVGSDQAVNEFFRGVVWNDDPAILLFHEDLATNWWFTTGWAWRQEFNRAGKATANDVTNLTGRSHYWDLSFLHAMATNLGEAAADTLAKVMLWAEVTYRLSTEEGVTGTQELAAIPIASSASGGGATYSYTLASFFDARTRPTGRDTIGFLLAQGTACRSLDLSRRAIGSLLHLVQDSYARGHVKRTLLNPGDLIPGTDDTFTPGTYGHYGEVENFHCYRGQKGHGKYDAPAGAVPVPGTLASFNALIGARDAIDASVKLLDMWQAKKAWAAADGPKKLLEETIFKISPAATDANNKV